MPSKKAAAPADPDKLVRQSDGTYRSGDDRFGVEQSNGSWFVADHDMADDFGQPRVVGPLATLKLAKEAIPRLREGPTPLGKPIKPSKPRAGKPEAAPPARAETWIDRLPAGRRRDAERLVRALEREGLADAEDVAHAHVERGPSADPRPLARRILEGRLERLLTDAGADVEGRRLVTEAMRLVSVDGGSTGRDLPGWALVAVDADGTLTDRKLELD